jgi:hypothetical protein
MRGARRDAIHRVSTIWAEAISVHIGAENFPSEYRVWHAKPVPKGSKAVTQSQQRYSDFDFLLFCRK